MNLTLAFFLGFFLSFVGVVPPGLLNITAAKISLREGYSRGIIFSMGVCLTVMVQTTVALVFAKYLSSHPEVVDILQRAALVLFILIAVYFLFVAKPNVQNKPLIRDKSKRNRFFFGVFLAALNLFPIPYQAYMGLTFAGFKWLDFSRWSVASYVAGAAMGTFAMLYIYIFFFDKIRHHSFTSPKNMNLIIGGISAIVSLLTLISIIREI